MNNKRLPDTRAKKTQNKVDRRSIIASIISTAVTLSSKIAYPSDASAIAGEDAHIMENDLKLFSEGSWTVLLPLEPCGGGAVCVRFTVAGAESSSSSPSQKIPTPSLPFRVYRAIVDTGSPYLVIPDGDDDGFDVYVDADSGIGNPFIRWIQSFLENNVFHGNDDNLLPSSLVLEDSKYVPTEEIYGSQLGTILWKKSQIQFRDPQLVTKRNPEESDFDKLVFGVMDPALTRESGGALLGLVKNSNISSEKVQLRPTFLDQEQIRVMSSYKRMKINDNGNNDGNDNEANLDEYLELPISSFTLDAPGRKLILSSRSLLPSPIHPSYFDIIPLVDLRPLGDFVEHYACYVEHLVLNGVNVYLSPSNKRKIVAVFDSGLTGCLLNQPLWDELLKKENASNLDNKDNNNESNEVIQVDPNEINTLEVQILSYAEMEKQQYQNKIKQPSGKQNKILDGKTMESRPLVSIASGKSTSRLFYVAPISLDWFDDETTAPYVVVLGQTFLEKGQLTVDIENRRALFEERLKD